MPYLIWWAKQGDPAWIASQDELVCYLSVASQAYHNHPQYLSDALLVHGGATVYPWLQFVPGIVMAKLLGWGPLGILLAWRVLAGVSLALGFYGLLKHFLKHPWAAMGLTLFFLADAGLVWARPGFMQVLLGVQMFQTDPANWLNRFQVRYAALPAGSRKPDYLSAGWRQLEAGPHWEIWERTDRRER